MPRKPNEIKIYPTQEFIAAVKVYQQQHKLRSLSAAFIELAAKGLGGDIQPRAQWGGARNVDELIEAVDELTDYGRNDPTA